MKSYCEILGSLPLPELEDEDRDHSIEDYWISVQKAIADQKNGLSRDGYHSHLHRSEYANIQRSWTLD